MEQVNINNKIFEDYSVFDEYYNENRLFLSIDLMKYIASKNKRYKAKEKYEYILNSNVKFSFLELAEYIIDNCEEALYFCTFSAECAINGSVYNNESKDRKIALNLLKESFKDFKIIENGSKFTSSINFIKLNKNFEKYQILN